MIQHQPENNRFICEQNGHQCVLDYRVEGNDIDFTHTYVPTELRGQGLAEKIVREGLAWAKQQNYSLNASCSYVAKFLK